MSYYFASILNNCCKFCASVGVYLQSWLCSIFRILVCDTFCYIPLHYEISSENYKNIVINDYAHPFLEVILCINFPTELAFQFCTFQELICCKDDDIEQKKKKKCIKMIDFGVTSNINGLF